MNLHITSDSRLGQTMGSKDEHACKKCGLSFSRKRYLKKHKKVCYQSEKSSTEKHRLQCCVTKAKNSGVKQENLDNVGGSEFMCKKCDCSYLSAKLLHDHERSVHRVGCHTKSTAKTPSIGSESSLKKRKSSRGTLQCPECKVKIKQCSYSLHLKNHALKCINKKYLADFGKSAGQIYMCRYITCYLAFPCFQKLLQHELVHTGVEPYMCGACDKLSGSKHKHQQHIKNCMSRELLIYPCSFCGKFFGRLSHLWRHYQSHRPDKMECYFCGHCGEVFPTRLLLNKHNADTHQVIQPKTKSVVFQCKFCQQHLVTQKELLKHTKTYHLAEIASTSTVKEPPVSGTSSNKLVKQKRKTFSCRYCDKSFSKESKVTRHERIHTNEKPHMCHICGLAFTFKSRLKRHMQSECNMSSVRDGVDTAVDSETNGSEDAEAIKEVIDNDVICISSSPSPSPTLSSPSQTIRSIQIQRLDPVRVIGQSPSDAIVQVSSPDSIGTQNVDTPRDQVYLIQYDLMFQRPLTISIPHKVSIAAMRVLPTEQNDPAVPVPMKLERVL